MVHTQLFESDHLDRDIRRQLHSNIAATIAICIPHDYLNPSTIRCRLFTVTPTRLSGQCLRSQPTLLSAHLLFRNFFCPFIYYFCWSFHRPFVRFLLAFRLFVSSSRWHLLTSFAALFWGKSRVQTSHCTLGVVDLSGCFLASCPRSTGPQAPRALKLRCRCHGCRW
jgi:hypothetical protein